MFAQYTNLPTSNFNLGQAIAGLPYARMEQVLSGLSEGLSQRVLNSQETSRSERQWLEQLEGFATHMKNTADALARAELREDIPDQLRIRF